MLVQGGNSFLNNQSSQKKTQSRSSDAKSFDEMLQGSSQKRKRFSKSNTKSVSKKKDLRSEDVNDGQQAKVEDRSVAKKLNSAESSKRVEVSPSESHAAKRNKQNGSVGAHEKGHKANNLTVDVPKSELKNLESTENGIESHLSTNSSEVTKETLAENQKKIENMKNSFESMMAKQPVKNNASLESKISSQMNTQVNTQVNEQLNSQIKGLNSGEMKLGSEFKMAEKAETLDIDINSVLDTSSVEAKSGDDSAHAEADLDMNSMFNQMMEKELSVKDSDNSAFADELNQVGSSEKAAKAENMSSIVKQARAFVDDGGGSMEIHLQPEGLGKVHLKVAVDNGQVNVEMMTDNVAAKKALEEGLTDIKSALESQKLLVETLKVEMSQDYQKDFSDMNDHMQEQANRDFAEQFLDQFKQERDSRFSGMFDGFKSIQPNQKEPDLTLNQRNPYREAGKGSNLNLVA